MTIRVLAISGSPHRHGNTETLLDAFLEGAEGEGAVVEKVVLKDLSFTPCQGCNACHRKDGCIVQDELTPLFDRIAQADCLALASPIYTMGITAELKGLIDRGQFLWARKYIAKTLYYSRDHLRRHKGVFISTAGQSWDHVFDGAFPILTAFFDITGFEYWDNLIANNMDRYGTIRGHPTALAEAREKGRKVVQVIRKARGEDPGSGA
ncbi:MAG: flavodoxin family protein [Methanomicrobiales archaeon]|nr:flavodoxin family protein [Methanomicrobiales archaeon]MDD1638842.1 flavodoxin family protein [Methanomicrobiales archaeon]MDD1645378.1 flavodoxin family protein [Methanomicrobiales archaeon]MDD1647112.1 flavodoxin family protein [Methanomicrobiales archaeon]